MAARQEGPGGGLPDSAGPAAVLPGQGLRTRAGGRGPGARRSAYLAGEEPGHLLGGGPAELGAVLPVAGEALEQFLPVRPPADNRGAGRLDVFLAPPAVPADAQRLPAVGGDRSDRLRAVPGGA